MDSLTKPRCQDMVSVPAPRDANYLLWGDQQYPLEASLKPREAYFELDAAGICDIRGLTQQGQAIPVDQSLVTTEPVAAVAEPVAAVAESAGPLWLFLAVLAAVIAMVAGSVTMERRRRATDPTPRPENPYSGGMGQ